MESRSGHKDESINARTAGWVEHVAIHSSAPFDQLGCLVAGKIYKFLTLDGAKPRTFGVVVDLRSQVDPLSMPHLPDFAQIACDHPGAYAFGKIAILAGDGIHTFQATADGEVESAFCGNSTAAAIRAMQTEGPLKASLYGTATEPYGLSARVAGDLVEQTWLFPAPAVHTRDWQGRKVITLRSVNDYAILFGNLPDGMSAQAAREELVGSSPATKLAVVAETGDQPLVEFYNSNGRHGSAPLTGLAAIALAARSLPWVQSCFPTGELKCNAASGERSVSLPVIGSSSQDQVSLEFGQVAVSLEPVLAKVPG